MIQLNIQESILMCILLYERPYQSSNLLEQEWYILILLGFDDNKVLKNNWVTNTCSSVQELLS